MRSHSLVSLVLVLAVLLAGCGGQLPTALNLSPADGTARLGEISGLVEIRNPGQEAFTAAAENDRLQVGGQLRTGSESGVKLELSSGTILRVAPETYFTLTSNEQGQDGLLTHVNLEAGQVWVVLNGGEVKIETSSGSAGVRGSYMSVWVDPLTSDVWVTCLEGWCQAENPTAMMDMIAGQGCTLYSWNPEGNTPPPPPKLHYISQEEIDLFLAKNPEAAQVMDSIIATASALPALQPAETPPAPDFCTDAIQPLNGSTVDVNAPILLDWHNLDGAYKYVVTITKPSGVEKSVIAWNSSLQVDPADLPSAGNYQWQVTVYDQNIHPLCSAGPWTFFKPESPAPTPVADCFQLTAPAAEAVLGETGAATFTWTEQPDRYKYIFALFTPQGGEISEKVFTNSFTLDLAEIPFEGQYEWQVTAYDTNYRPICTAGPLTFTKPGTVVPTPDPDACVTLLTPANGTNYEGIAEVEFTWTEFPGAYKYIISFKPPSSGVSNFLAWEPTHTRFVESFTEGGTYQWWVTVKNEAIQDVCTSQIFTFTKPDTSHLVPTAPAGGEGEFWGQNGPTGLQSSCEALFFSVSTSAEGMIKVIYSLDSDVNGDYDPHAVIGNGPGSGAGTLYDFAGKSGKTIYWRFGVYNGGYTHDPNVYSFTCP